MLLSNALQIFLSFMFCTAAPDETLPYTSFTAAAGLRAEPASTPSLGLHAGGQQVLIEFSDGELDKIF